eukprot:2918696-Rhodomonas_salina.1
MCSEVGRAGCLRYLESMIYSGVNISERNPMLMTKVASKPKTQSPKPYFERPNPYPNAFVRGSRSW